MVKVENLCNVHQASTYFKEHFATDREKYYSQEGAAQGEWAGKLARDLGLSGAVTEREFLRLMEGQDPVTGEQRIRSIAPHKYVVQRGKHQGEERITRGHRPGMDMQLSAPKSVSWQYVHGKDKRILEVFQRANQKAIAAMEEYAKARIGGEHPDQLTGRMIAVKFQHDAARPVNGYVSAQLHEHFIVGNITQTEDGRWHSLQNDRMFDEQNRVGTAVQYSELAYGLRGLGYEIEVRNGVPEIQGYSRAFIEEASKRHAQIEKEAAKFGEKGNSAGYRNNIAKSTRESKGAANYEFTEHTARDLETQYEVDPLALTQAARQRSNPIEIEVASRPDAAREAVDYARDHNLENEAAVDELTLQRDALRRCLGTATVDDIRREMKAREERGEFVERSHGRYNERTITTDKHRQMESEILDILKAGKETEQPICKQSREELHTRFRSEGFNEGQAAALAGSLTSRDRIQGVQGRAGTGKTFKLKRAAELAEQAGFHVKGMSGQSGATRGLSEVTQDVENIQKHNARLENGRAEHSTDSRSTLYIIDEAGQIGAADMHKFLSNLQPGDRVLLVGDTRQHDAVPWGKPFAQMQDAGMTTYELSEVKRQRDPELKQLSEHLSQGRIPEACELLEKRTKFIQDPAARMDRMVADFLDYTQDGKTARAGVLDNTRKREFNERVREGLKARGQITGPEHSSEVLIRRQELSKADLKYADRYEPGNVVRYERDNPEAGIRAGDYARVAGFDQRRNRLTVEHNGRQIEYNPKRRYLVNVYRSEQRVFAVGDRVQFTDQWQKHQVANRDHGTICAIDAKGNVAIELDPVRKDEPGREVRFQLSERREIEYGYASTATVSQGISTPAYFAELASEINPNLGDQKSGYVLCTRETEHLQAYARSREDLRETLERINEKTTALRPDEYRQREQTPEERDAVRSRGEERVLHRAAPYKSAAQEFRELNAELNTNAYQDVPQRRSAAQEFAELKAEMETVAQQAPRPESPQIIQKPVVAVPSLRPQTPAQRPPDRELQLDPAAHRSLQKQPSLQGAKLKFEGPYLEISEATQEQREQIQATTQKYYSQALAHMTDNEKQKAYQNPAVTRAIDRAIAKDLEKHGAQVERSAPELDRSRPARIPTLYYDRGAFKLSSKIPIQDRERFRQEIVEPAIERLVAGKNPQDAERITSSLERMYQTGTYTGDIGDAVRGSYTQQTRQNPVQVERPQKEYEIEQSQDIGGRGL